MMVKLKRQMVRCREGYCWEIECATHGEGERKKVETYECREPKNQRKKKNETVEGHGNRAR